MTESVPDTSRGRDAGDSWRNTLLIPTNHENRGTESYGIFGQLTSYSYFDGRYPIHDLEDDLRDDGPPFTCVECGSLIDPDDWMKVFNDSGDDLVFCYDDVCGFTAELCDSCRYLDLSSERPECENGCPTEPLLHADLRLEVREPSEGEIAKGKEYECLLAMIRTDRRSGLFLYAGYRFKQTSTGSVPAPFTVITSEPIESSEGLQLIGSFDTVEEARLAGDLDVAWRNAGWQLTSAEVAAKLGLNSVAALAQVPLADLLPYLTAKVVQPALPEIAPLAIPRPSAHD